MKREKKVKIDRKVLFELLSIYQFKEDCHVKVMTNYGNGYRDDWWEETLSPELIKKANNILRNS